MNYRIEISSMAEAENEYFSQEIRQLLYGRGRNSYRVLFTILEEAEAKPHRP
jgi:hypothetical protein